MAERGHVSQCISSSDAFHRDNRAVAFAIRFWVLFLFITNALQLIAVLASFCCLRLPRPTQAVQSADPGWPCMQQPVATTRCASSIPPEPQ